MASCDGPIEITWHFRRRCAERVGPSIDPDHLGQGIARAIEDGGGPGVTYLGRGDRGGTRYFEIEAAGRTFVVVANTDTRSLVTIYAASPPAP